MTTYQEPTTGARVRAPRTGRSPASGVPDRRFMIDGADRRQASVVEHTVAPHVLAGPLHHHTREDE